MTLGLKKGLFPIAWGYLKPVGYSQTYLGSFKIQLYKYKFIKTPEFKEIRKKNNPYLRTPDVLFEFNWINREKYQTFIEIEIKLEEIPGVNEVNNKLYLQRKFKNSLFNNQEYDINFDEEEYKLRLNEEKKLKYAEFDHTAHLKRKVLLRRKRHQLEECKIPDKLLFKFTTDKLGCLTHKFSPDGKYLAGCLALN